MEFMDTKLALLSTAMLLYREAEIQEKKSGSKYLARRIANAVKIDDKQLGRDVERDIKVGLKETINYLIDDESNDKPDKGLFLQTINMNVGNDKQLVRSIEAFFSEDLDREGTVNQIAQNRKQLLIHSSRQKTVDKINELYKQINFKPKEINWDTFHEETIESIRDLKETGSPRSASLVQEINMSDETELNALLKEGVDSVCGDGIMKTGWQGLNDMLDGGFRRSEQTIVGALRHNFKSGFMLNVTRQVICYNKPYMIDETKKPCVVFMSLENELKTNVIQYYRNIIENETGKEANIGGLTDDQIRQKASKLLAEKAKANGYEFIMLRYDPANFTYMEMFLELNAIMARGYEIHLLTIDYVGLMSLKGTTAENSSKRFQEIFSRIRNFCSTKGIAQITGAQLSPDAVNLMRDTDRPGDFVKMVAGKSYYADCKGIDKEADLEITIHIEKPNDGHSYLTLKRGKHRKPTITPEKYLYCVYRFEAVGDIPDDINGESQARNTVGGNTASEGGGGAWYDAVPAAA